MQGKVFLVSTYKRTLCRASIFYLHGIGVSSGGVGVSEDVFDLYHGFDFLCCVQSISNSFPSSRYPLCRALVVHVPKRVRRRVPTTRATNSRLEEID